MDTTWSDQLVRRLIAGDAAVIDVLVGCAATSDDPVVLVAAALAAPARRELLGRAAAAAAAPCDRRTVAVAAAYLDGDADRALLLARDHLADHPDSPIVAHIAEVCARRPPENETRNLP